LDFFKRTKNKESMGAFSADYKKSVAKSIFNITIFIS